MGVNTKVRPRMSMGAAAKDKERERERAMRRFPAFETKVPKPFRRKKPEILQLNIGLYCNQVSHDKRKASASAADEPPSNPSCVCVCWFFRWPGCASSSHRHAATVMWTVRR
mmetsp:Transcript_11664/g.29715  ORF Transcript_11664/g.29715 Transcript_11664/m.29715 type:complete len:112 (+) Transcript_11664:87-422(+)